MISSYKEHKGFPGGTNGKEPTCQCRRLKRHKFDPWRRAWQPTPVFFLENSIDSRAWWAQLELLSMHTHKEQKQKADQ